MIKLMLVDDESRVREAIRNLLPWDELGVEIIGSCANSLEALNAMTNEMPDILITDIKMPVMDGIELIGQAKRMYPYLQCVVLSAYDEFALAQKAMSKGVKFYLLKPCSKESLTQVVKSCMKEIRTEKRDLLNEFSDHHRAMRKVMSDLLNLQVERDGEIHAEQIRELIDPYKDIGLLREAVTALVMRYWKNNAEIKQYIPTLSQMFDSVENMFENVALLLNQMQVHMHNNNSFVDEVVLFVDSHYHMQDLTLFYIADHVVHMNAQYIGKCFNKKIGMKFSDYLLKVRMEHAVALLVSDEPYRVYEVAQRVGLGNNIQYFHQLFKRYTGMTPKEFDKARRQKTEK